MGILWDLVGFLVFGCPAISLTANVNYLLFCLAANDYGQEQNVCDSKATHFVQIQEARLTCKLSFLYSVFENSNGPFVIVQVMAEVDFQTVGFNAIYLLDWII